MNKVWKNEWLTLVGLSTSGGLALYLVYFIESSRIKTVNSRSEGLLPVLEIFKRADGLRDGHVGRQRGDMIRLGEGDKVSPRGSDGYLMDIRRD